MFLGIDLGTSGLKCVWLNRQLEILHTAYRGYDVLSDLDGGAEQQPEMWWGKLQECLEEGENFEVQAVGFSGQMHGLVALDETGNPVCNAILWNDRRAKPYAEQVNTWLETHPNGICNQAASGFLLPSLLWLKENRPDAFSRIYRVMLPKDYLRLKLTGVWCSDYGDASGTGAFDLLHQCWQNELLQAFELPAEIFPPLYPPDRLCGSTQSGTSLAEGIPVCCGSGDHAMQLMGNGVCSVGERSCNIGTASQISITVAKPQNDSQLYTNLFCHCIAGQYNQVGASLNGGILLKWMNQVMFTALDYQQLDRLAKPIEPGSDGVVVLPYLCGERNGTANANLRASIHGLSLEHQAGHLIHAAMEGVVFNLRQIQERFTMSSDANGRLTAAGGGARSQIWLQMQADILHCDVFLSSLPEQAAVGAASIAGIAVGLLAQEEVIERLRGYTRLVASPNFQTMKRYDDCYERYVMFANR